VIREIRAIPVVKDRRVRLVNAAHRVNRVSKVFRGLKVQREKLALQARKVLLV
jgi:hypothetical protein